MSGIQRLGDLTRVLQAEFSTPAVIKHNVQASYEVLVPAVLLGKSPTVLITHSMPEGAEILGQALSDGKVSILLTNRTGSDLAAGQVLTIRIRQ